MTVIGDVFVVVTRSVTVVVLTVETPETVVVWVVVLVTAGRVSVTLTVTEFPRRLRRAALS